MQPPASTTTKSGLTRALEELTTLLPKALECCTDTESSQNLLVFEKLRSVLLTLLHDTLAQNAAKHIVAALRILQLCLEKLPGTSTFAEGAQEAVLVHVVLFLCKLPDHQEAVGEHLAAALCSLSDLLAAHDTQLLQELHAGTVDLVLDLEQVLFSLTAAAHGQQQEVAAAQLSLYPTLLATAAQQAAAAEAGQGASQAQQLLLQATAQPVSATIQDAGGWEAFAQLALQLLVHQLQQSPSLVGCATPGGARLLVPALGQMLSYGSAPLQELCLGLMTLLVLQQPQDSDTVTAATNHAVWMLQCAAEGQLPAQLLCLPSMQALTACLSSCTAALHELGLLGLHCDRLVQALAKALACPVTRPFAPMWLSLMQQAVSLSPQHAGTAGLVLPLRTCAAADAAAAAAAAAAAGGSACGGGGGGGGWAVGSDTELLQQTWRQVGCWMAAAETRDAVVQQLLSLFPSLKPPVRQQQQRHASGEASGSPAKKKRRNKQQQQQGSEGQQQQKKYKQMQFTVTEGGFVSSQRPSKGSGGSGSSQPSSDPTAPAAAGAQSASHAALQAMHQLLQLQPAAPAAAAAARIAALVAALGPDATVPVELLPALGVAVSAADAAAGSAARSDTGADVAGSTVIAAAAAAGPAAQDRLEMLLLLLQGLTSCPAPCAAVVACLSQQVVSWLALSQQQGSGTAELVSTQLQALLLALAATVRSIAAEPGSVEVHVRVWQHAQEALQGTNNIFSSSSGGHAAVPGGLLAAVAVAWLTATRLMGWSGSSALNAAAAQVQHACSSGSTSSSSCVATASGLLLLPVLSVLQHLQFSDAQQAFVPAGVASGGGGGSRSKPACAASEASEAAERAQQQQEAQQAVTRSFLEGCAAAAASGADRPAVQMASLHALSQLLQLFAAGASAAALAAVLQDAADRVLQLGAACSSANGAASAAAGGASLDSCLRVCVGSLTRVQLPQLLQLLPVLQPALATAAPEATNLQLQAAALQLLSSYLGAVGAPDVLEGARQPLQDALSLLTAQGSAVRDAALGLVQQYLQPSVLQAVWGGQQTEEEAAAIAAATNAAPDGQDLAAAAAAAADTLPQRRLLQHLQGLLQGCSSKQSGAAAAGGGRLEAVQGATVALMRSLAGLFAGLVGTGCEDLPLLQLLQQVTDDNAQVSAVAFDLLQHLAAQHTSRQDVRELLLEGPAAPALLTAVGRSLHTQPALFQTVAELCKVDDFELADAVAPYTVQWLCQHQLKDALEVLASKLGEEPSTLLIGAADAVVAHMLWFSSDSLQRFTKFVDSIMQPESTFITVVTVLGRKIVRRVVQLAGLPCFWDGQYQPPPSLLTRAREYVGILASIMELPQPASTAELLQGEAIALLLKSIGNTLAKRDDSNYECAASHTAAAPSGQQQQQQQPTAAAAAAGKAQAADGASMQQQLSGVAAEKLQGLRALVVLMYLLREHLGSHALQLMAVLSESLIYCTHGAPRMQALTAWLCFVQLLAKHAPQVLERVAAQAAVVLLPVLEPADTQGNGPACQDQERGGGQEPDAAAVKLAAQVLHAIVVQHRQLVRTALRNMPPLPSLAVLKEVNAVLIQEQGRQSPLQQLQLLMASLRHESIAVRHVALGEVRSFLLQHKSFIADTQSGLLTCSTRPALQGPPNGGHSAAAAALTAAAAAAAAAATAAPGKAGSKAGGSAAAAAAVKLSPVQCQDVFSELLAALMASCENLGRDSLAASMKQRCAQCLGVLGAIDPSRVQPELPRPSPFQYDAQHFLVSLVQDHLVRVLQTASDIAQLEMTSYALQQILQHYTASRMQRTHAVMKGPCSISESARLAASKALAAQPDGDQQQQDPAAAGGLYSLLGARCQSIVAPFLTTRFTQTPGRSNDTSVVFGSHHHTFRRWLYLWLKQLAAHVNGPLAAAFESCRGVTSWDQPLMLFMLPMLMVEAAGPGAGGLQLVAQEIHAVMQCAADGHNAQDPTVFVADIELYLQCIFTQLDLLQQWVQKQQELCDKAAEQQQQQQQQQKTAGGSSRAASSSTSPEVQLPPFVANVAALVSAVPIQTMAQAALKCGAYARALQYFETFVRQQHGGGLNPAAYVGGCSSYGYDEVSFLLEVYGHLEEPDGIAGLAQLRQGGLTSTDQILVAEKAGAWSEALALYEQALSQEASAAAAAAAAGAAGPAADGGGGGGEAAAADAPGSKRLGAAAADVLINAACAVVSGAKQHTLGTWMALEQVQPAAAVAVAAAAGDVDAGAAAGALLGQQQQAQGACISSLQVGHLRCLLQMGHQQMLLRQVDGLMARCLGQASAAAAAVTLPGAAAAGAAVGAESADAVVSGPLQAVQWSLGQLAALGVAAAWRLGAWEQLRGYLSVLEAAGDSPAGMMRPLSAADRWECCMGAILEAAERGAHKEVARGVSMARANVLSLLPAIAGESYSRAYPDLLKLHMLQELEDAWTLHRASPSGVSVYQRTKGLRWKHRLDVVAPLLSSCEPLLALRRQLAGMLDDAEGMGRCWLQHAKLCRATGHQEAAETSVLEAQARAVPGALLERCRLLWDRDKGHRAMLELQLVLQQQLEAVPADDGAQQHQHAKEMLQLTEWMAAVGQGDKEMLCEHYRESILLDQNWERSHFAFGRYLDNLYSDAKQREGKPVQAKGQDRLGGRSRIKVEEDNPYLYLSEALKHYGESVRLGHKAILQSLPRLLTLYFEFGSKVAATKSLNQKLRTAQTQITGVMHSLIRSIPTYKWLLVLPQLTSRMCHVQADVQEFMQQLLVAIVEQFPHQALWSMAVVVKSTIRARQEAATAVLQAAKRRSSESGRRLFENFQRLTDQLIKTCMWQPPQDRRSNRCSAQKEFSRLVALLPVEVQMPVQSLFTVDLPPGGKLLAGHRPVCAQTFIAGLKDEVIIMSSLMKPKKITFVGSDGLEYPFLAKPKDDLRKDYRLMDFAGTLNALLARTPGARRRGLALRTYAVLPLTDDCGILQWVNNLVPFKMACEEIYIKEKMYKRHRTPMQIKVMYDNFSGQHFAQLLDQVLKLLPPRMSKWMLNRFTDPGTWLAARLAFTRTNAAWAMVGHVLGLGDRHGENIMIDGLTGETLHVDFGCLFDRGLTLEVPERVPFRMTQNVVDCFGVSGVDGTFRRAAEMTLQVLRDNRPTLMTCAETFLHDPLVDWTSGKRGGAQAAAAGGLEAENPQAKDALHVMDGRLSGTLLGVLSTPSLPLSVEGQAARLIDEATDHENLGRMYIWWMPWM